MENELRHKKLDTTLPDGNTQIIHFDAFGRVEYISRSNIGNVSYVYDNEHDRLKEKTVLGLRESYEYDLAGRVNSTVHEKELSFLESMLSLIQLYSPIERYEFSHEGSAIAEVRHSDFTKKFLYTPDDKPELKSLKTKAGLSIDLEFGYNKFRYLEEQKISNVYTKQFIYDDYRQLGLVKIGNQTFSVKRDGLGKISRIILPNKQVFYVDYDSLTQGRLGHSSDLGSYYWGFNNRGLITNTSFTSSSDACDPKTLGFVYAPDKTLQEPAFAKATAGRPSSRGRGIYDENRHRIGTYKNGYLDSIRFENIVRTTTHLYEKFSIEGIDLGILIDGQFKPCLFDQVGSLIAIGETVSIPSAFGERADYLPIFEYFDYAGQGRDPETGLIAMGERDYDPRTHQFTSPDRHFLENPEECIKSPQECDLYSYAKNNPLLYVDADGQMAQFFVAGFVALGRATWPYVAAAAKNIIKENVQLAVRDFVSSSASHRGFQNVAEIAPGKFDYIFGKATGIVNAEHNNVRTGQNLFQMKRLGIDDTPGGRQLLKEHFERTINSETNLLREYKNQYGSFEIRQSLLAGPSGRFVILETTWKVMDDGVRRFSTILPKESGK